MYVCMCLAKRLLLLVGKERAARYDECRRATRVSRLVEC